MTAFFGPPVQVAYVVADLDEAMRRWRSLGVGLFLVRRHVAVQAAHQERPAVVDHSIGLAQWGSVMLELVEYHDIQPPSLAAALEPQDAAPHHIAVFVDSIGRARSEALDHAWGRVLDLRTATGLDVSFFDARAELGVLVECYEQTPALRGLYDLVASHAGDRTDRVSMDLPG